MSNAMGFGQGDRIGFGHTMRIDGSMALARQNLLQPELWQTTSSPPSMAQLASFGPFLAHQEHNIIHPQRPRAVTITFFSIAI
jgi:hypothetical protein